MRTAERAVGAEERRTERAFLLHAIRRQADVLGGPALRLRVPGGDVRIAPEVGRVPSIAGDLPRVDRIQQLSRWQRGPTKGTSPGIRSETTS